MLTRHQNELLSRLEQVADLGCTFIRKKELLLWYGQERITVGIWRDLEDKWREVEENEEHTLLVGSGDDGFALIWGEGLQGADAWFQSVTLLSKRN